MIVIQSEVASNEKIKIGLIVPLSGEYSYIGKSILKSTRMALNKIDDQRITIIPKDTRANPIDTLRVSNELNSMGINIICLLYTSPSPRDLSTSRMPSSA